MIENIITWIERLAYSVPLSLFVVIGGFVEEIIAPIPSPLVTTLAGTIAKTQHVGLLYVLWICVLSTAAKTFGAWVFFYVGKKFEAIFIPRFGKYIGVTHEDVTQFGSRFDGKKKDFFVLAIIRAIPVMPSTPISLACGMVEIGTKTFCLATFLGFFIRNGLFMLLGFSGLSAVESLMQGLDSAESILKILIVLAGIIGLGWLYWMRKSGKVQRWFR